MRALEQKIQTSPAPWKTVQSGVWKDIIAEDAHGMPVFQIKTAFKSQEQVDGYFAEECGDDESRPSADHALKLHAEASIYRNLIAKATGGSDE
jgi:hypothetical protein